MKKSVLFICLGNICRSPAAEAVFKEIVGKEGLSEQINCDSAGIAGYHIGETADRRMQCSAMRHGYKLTSIARKFDPSKDFNDFDYIVGMDDSNIHDLKRMAGNDGECDKIFKITDFCITTNYCEVPDPYYGGTEGFELVLQILEDACNGFLNKIKKEIE